MGSRDISTLEGAPFVVKTYQLVCDPNTNSLVSWSTTRDSFIVWKPVEFAHDVLPKYFKHNNFCSFIRQLNTYGFHKVETRQWEFKHELFLDGKPELLKEISRRKSKKRETSDSIKQSEEDREEDTDTLKGVNSLLMKEVIRLQAQQDATQGALKKILDELIESRKETKELKSKVADLEDKISEAPPPKRQQSGNTTNGFSMNNVHRPSTHIPPQNNVSLKSETSPQLQASCTDSSPLSCPNPSPTLQSNTFMDEHSLLGLEDLAHLELGAHGGMENEFVDHSFVNILQNATLTPPQSPYGPPCPNHHHQQQHNGSTPAPPSPQYVPASPPACPLNAAPNVPLHPYHNMSDCPLKDCQLKGQLQNNANNGGTPNSPQLFNGY